MSKKNKVIYLDSPHRYSLGSFMNNLTGNIQDGKFTTGLFKGMSSNTGAALNSGVSLAGGIAGKLIGNGLQSTAGSVFNTIGDIGGAIPGPWGMAIGAGAKVLGGLANAAFGTKVDQEKLNAANQGTDYLNSFTSNASYFDEVEGPQAQAAVEDAYKGGWFKKSKAQRQNEELRQKRAAAQDFAINSVQNNISNIADDQMDNMLANYAAFGGPLDFGLFPVGGAIDYELAQRRLAQKDLEINKKSFGGPLHTHGADWTNGITIIDNGGSHEENPLEGVPMGMASDGLPNLVEEGEVIFNDYVFSNRIKVPQAVREKYKLRGTKEMTFADAAKKAQKESEERPNDPISKRGLEDIMYKLMGEQEQVRQKKAAASERKFAKGGKILAHKHATDPYLDTWEGTPYPLPSNYWEGMESPLDYNFPGLRNQEYGRTWGPVTTVTPKESLSPIAPVGDEGKATTSYTPLWSVLGAPRTRVPQTESGTTTRTSDTHNSWLTGLRFVPAVGAALGVFSDLAGWTNKRDYSNARAITDIANSIGNVRATPIGDYLRNRRMDRLFYANQLAAQANAGRRGILNTAGGNRGAAMAGLLASDRGALGQLGNLYRQVDDSNFARDERVATFNRGTNMFNAENSLRAQMANKDVARVKIDAAARAAAMRDAIDARVDAARSANLTNLFDSIGDIGREAFAMDMIRNNRGLLYDWMGRYKGKILDDADGKKAHGGCITIKKRRK